MTRDHQGCIMTNAPPTPIPDGLLERIACLPLSAQLALVTLLEHSVTTLEKRNKRPASRPTRKPDRQLFGWSGQVPNE